MKRINPYIIKIFDKVTKKESEIMWVKSYDEGIEHLTQIIKDNRNPNLFFALDITKPERFINDNSLIEEYWK